MVGAPCGDPGADGVARSNHGGGQWREGPLALFGFIPCRDVQAVSYMKSDWGISGREGMNIMDTQTKRPLSPDPICFGPFRLSITERVFEKEGVPVRLGSRALDILIALVERPGEVVTKKDLFARVWPDLVVDESNLRYHVSALRKALGERQSGTCYVTNVSGRGYCFVVPILRAASGLREGSTI
jgi:DNA-binding winged helix-turn-helix (wHTH) protein